VRLAAGVALAVVLLLPVPLAKTEAGAALLVALPAAVAGFVAFVRWRGRFLLGAVAVACALSFAADAAYRGPQDYAVLWALPEYLALLVLVTRTIRSAPGRVAALLGPATALAVVLLPIRALLAHPASDALAVALLCALSMFPAACAAGLGLYLRLLAVRRARAVDDLLAAQRLSVAADLHDFVAHELTGIVVEVQAAQWEQAYQPDQMRELLGRVEAAGVRALDSMDRTVASLRTGTPPRRLYRFADLTEVTDRFGATLRLDEALGPVADTTQQTGYRIVVEALTNVRRHAAGAQATVTVAPSGTGAIAVTVTDTGGHRRRRPGGGAGPGEPGRYGHGGTGLAGLAARVDALGGTLRWGPQGDGWQVHAVLPR
jgi:signal transduction histidine kinase